jgi:hypothetical protein
MPIRNRLTQVLGIEHPIILAPMDLVSGGRLAAAVTQPGGLGLLGGGMETGTGLSENGPARAMLGSAAALSPGALRSIPNYWMAYSLTNPPLSCCRSATHDHSRRLFIVRARR